ncbi:MAG: sugar phosphate isomerase/epimerase [Planctomycetes bacterium]|jgi:sugar phosphate isomerase/epimerase|nr:sugar phosphate isomerase/epimerase [Planctomycetota bacterium]
MLLGYQSNGLQNHRLPEALQLLAANGYQAVGLTPDTCHLDPTITTDRDLDRLAALLRELGLVPVMETGARFLLDPQHKHEPTLMTVDAAARQRRLEFYRRAAAMGARLGAEVLSFWSGIDRAPGADSGERLRAGVRAAGAAIAAEGLVPSLEPEPGMAVATFAQWLQLREELGSEAPALTLDVGHLYAEWEGEPVDVIGAAGPFLRQVQLEDMRRGVHEHLLPGTGDVDFDGVLTAIENTGYRGPVCFELGRDSHRAPAAVAACRAVWDRFGAHRRR